MKDNRRRLYDALSKEYDLGSFEQFSADIEDDAKRKKLYDATSGEYDYGDYNSFSSQLGFAKDNGDDDSVVQDQTASVRLTAQDQPVAVSPVKPVVRPAAQEESDWQQKDDNPYASARYDFKPMNGLENQREMSPQYENTEEQEGVPQFYDNPTPLDESKAYYDLKDKKRLERANREQVKELAASIDSALEESMTAANTEYTEKRKQLDEDLEHKGWLTRQLAKIGMSTTADVDAGITKPGTDESLYGEAGSERRQEIESLQAAQRSMKTAQQIINEADTNAKDGTLLEWLDSSFAGGALRGLGQKFFDVTTWDMGEADSKDAIAVSKALKKFDDGEPLTKAEQALLDAKSLELATTAYFGSYLGRGYKAGQVTAESIPFMIEMCLNPASGVGEAASNKMARYAISRFGKEAAKKTISKVTRGAGRVAADLAGAAAMTATSGAVRTTADALNRMNGEIGYDTEDNGYSVFERGEQGDSVGTAIAKAFAATTIENYSEMVGEYFKPILGAAGGKLTNGLDKITHGKVSQFIDGVDASDVARLVTDFEKNSKWSGPIGEYAEEVVGGVMNALVVGDQTLDTDEQTGVFNLDNNIDTFLGVSLLGGFMSAVKTASYRSPKYRAKKSLDSSDRQGAASFSDDIQQWEKIRDGIDNDANEGLHDVLISDDYNDAQRAAAIKYAKARMEYTGAMEAEQSRRVDPETPPEQTDLETSYDNGYTLEEDQEKNDARNNYEYQLAQLKEKIGADDYTLEDLARDESKMTPEQRQTAMDYLNAKATFDGMVDHVRDDIDGKLETIDSVINKNVSQSDGMIHPATTREGKRVYIVTGGVQTDEDGNVLRDRSDQDLIVRDADTGKLEFTSAEDISNVEPALDPVAEKEAMADQIRQTMAQEAASRIDGILPFQPGDTYSVMDADGQRMTMQVTPNEEGITEYPDGSVNVRVNQETDDKGAPIIQRMAKEEVQKMADAANLARLDEYVAGVREKKAQQAAAEQVVAEQAAIPPQETAAAPVAEETKPTIPIDEKGRKKYTSVPVQQTYDDIYNDEAFESREEADGFVEGRIKKADKEMVEAQKKYDAIKPENYESPSEYREAKNKAREVLNPFVQAFEYWTNVKQMSEENARREAEAENARLAQEAEAATAAEQQAESAPVAENVEEAPAEAAVETPAAEQAGAVSPAPAENTVMSRETLTDIANRTLKKEGDLLEAGKADTELRNAVIDAAYDPSEANRQHLQELASKKAGTPLADAILAAVNGESTTQAQTPVQQSISAAAEQVNTNPTDAQKEAGNYKKGHVRIDGFDISIENPKGSVRRGTDKQGNAWENTMQNNYGYIRGTKDKDGDQIDVFLSDNPESGKVYVVDQVNPETGEFDEHKVMYGFNSAEEAAQAYMSNYAPGWKGMGAITEVSKEDFKKWADSSKRKTKPFSEYRAFAQQQASEQTAPVAEAERPVEGAQSSRQSDVDEALSFVTGKPVEQIRREREMQSARKVIDDAQKALSEAKSQDERAAIIKQMLDTLGARNTVVTTMDGLVEAMNAKGASENTLGQVTAMVNRLKSKNGSLEGFYDPETDNIFMVADGLPTAAYANRINVHEDKHMENRRTGAHRKALSTGVSREELQSVMRRYKKTDEYDRFSNSALADEVLAVSAEIAEEEGADAIPARLRELGVVNEDFINFAQSNIDYGRRNGQRRHVGSRDSLQHQNAKETGRQDGRNRQQGSREVGGSERRTDGSRAGGSRRGGSPEAQQRLNDKGIAANNEEARFSVRYVPSKEEEKQIIDDIAEAVGVSKKKAKQWLRSETALATVILDEHNSPYLNYTADGRYTAIKQDSDYPQGTVDFNNICRKRLAFTDMYQRIQKAFPNKVITGADLATIRNIMKEHGMTVACGLCYVEDRRQLLGEIARGFIIEADNDFRDYEKGSEQKKKNAEKFRKLLGDDRKEDLSIYDLITLEGSTKLSKEHPGIYNAFQAFNAARGQQAGNLFEGYAEYKREILKWSKKKVDSVNANGGLRIFSYSDFEAHHLIDLVQIIQDCARKGVMIQGYTKVPAFARAVANTGIKLNRSLIPLGDTGIVDGKLAYDPVEGIDINDKDFLPDNDNVGNILIGINDEQIRLAMADPFVHYIIPYHSNQSGVLRQMKQTGAWTNYKNEQTEKGENVGKHGVNIYTDVLAAAEAEGKPIKNEREFVERFLKVCKEKGWTPRFARFLNTNEKGEYVYTPGYYKLLLDFKLFDADGKILPQKPVVAEFDDEFNKQILDDYVKDAKAGTDAELDEVYDEIVKELRFSVTGESDQDSIDRDYMKAVEAGDMEKAQKMVRDAAANMMQDSVVLDADGLPKKVLHGTNSDFSVFDERKIGSATDAGWLGRGFYFYGNNPEYASQYGRRVIGAYLNIENPYFASYEDISRLAEANSQNASAEFRQEIEDAGYDGVFYNGDLNEEWVAFYPNQIKSADPVTYDDEGNVIPLSKRFDSENNDIRFSVAYHGSTADFDAFDINHAGEGEGYASHGFGHYVAFNKDTGTGYAWNNAFESADRNGQIEPDIAETLRNDSFDDYDSMVERYDNLLAKKKEDVRNELEEERDEKNPDETIIRDLEKEQARLEKYRPLTEVFDGMRNVYTVEIPDDTGDNYIDEMRTLPKEGRRRIADVVRSMPDSALDDGRRIHGPNWLRNGLETLANVIEREQLAGLDLRRRLVDALGSEKEASRIMHDAGFVGIKYNGRADGPCAVIFSNDDLQITDHLRFSVANRNEEIFISNAAKAVEEIPMEKATPQQWLKMIEGKGGLKAGEDKWIGLSDWLKASEKKTLTKQDLEDYIHENQIRIEEVHYSENARYKDQPFYADRYDATESDDVLPADGTRMGYTTDGLTNKKEIALTVPTIEPWNESDKIHFGDAGGGRAIAWTRFGDTWVSPAKDDAEKAYREAEKAYKEYREQIVSKYALQATGTKTTKDLATPEENAKAKELQMESVRLYHDWQYGRHPRQRVLVIDEIQSKRHQEGREKGYQPSVDDYMKEKGLGIRETEKSYELYWLNDGRLKASVSKTLPEAETEEKAKNYLVKTGVMDYNGRPAAAPFEKNWQELAMKRMLRLAAEEGYDHLAWTTGEQQAERYNLGHVIDDIWHMSEKNHFNFNKDGYSVGSVWVDDNGVITDGNRIFEGHEGKNLSEFVGKELADKMMASKPNDEIQVNRLVGGEGMKGFYDDMLPRFMNKYGKKWGVKVHDITLPNVYDEVGHPLVMHSIDVTPEMKESVMQGQTMFSVAGDRPIDEIVEDGRQKVAKQNQEATDLLSQRIRRINAKLSDIRRAAAAQREYDRSTVTAITDAAKELLSEGALSDPTRQEINRLLSVTRWATGRKDITGAADALMDIMISNQLRHGKDMFEKLLKIRGSKVDAKGVEVQGKLDKEGQIAMQAFKSAMDMSAENIQELIDTATDRLSSDDKTIADNAAIELPALELALEYVQNVKDSMDEEKGMRNEIKQADEDRRAGKMTAAAYRQFVDATEAAIRENRMDRVNAYQTITQRLADSLVKSIAGAKAFNEKEQARIEKIHHFANSDLVDVPSDEHTDNNDSLANMGLLRFFLKPLATFDQMLRQFGSKSTSGEGYLWNHFMRGWTRATGKEYRGLKAATDELDAKASEVFDRKMRWSDLYSIERKMPKVGIRFWDGGKMKDHELTQGNLLYIYMVNKMADGRMKLRRMGIDEDVVDAIEQQLDPRFKELADWLQGDFLVRQRNKYNEVHERMFGAPMAAIENYFPLKVLANARVREVDMAAPELNATPATITGSVIKRRKNSLALDVLGADAFSVVIEHLQDMEHWAAFAEFNRDLNTLLSYKKFRNRVQNMKGLYGSGNTAWENFRKSAEMAAGVYRPAVTKDSVDTSALNIAKGVTAAKITFRVYTAIKQLLSMPAFISDANVGILAKYMATPWKAWNWAMKELPMFEKRWKSRQAGDTRLMKTDSDWKLWKNNFVEAAGRFGMSPNAFVDALTVSIGARAMYETRKKRYLKDGYTEEEAEQRAKEDAQILYNETQQSNESAFVSSMQVDRTWASVALTVFRNSSMGYQRQLVDALRNLKHMASPDYKEKSVEFMRKQMVRDGLDEVDAQAAAERIYRNAAFRNATRVAVFGFVMQLAWNLGKYLPYLLAGDDDDEKKKMLEDAARQAMVGGFVEGLSAGNLISEAGNLIASGEGLKNYSPGLMPVVSDVQRIIKMMDYDWPAGVNEIANLVIQSGIGVNPQTITDMAVAIYDACNGDMETTREATLLIMRLLQVPQSQLDKVYIDGIDMKADKGLDLTVKEFAKRYAKYKVNRGAPATGWAYPEELREKRENAYIKRFTKQVEELKKTRGSDTEKAFLEYLDEYNAADKTLRELKSGLKKARSEGNELDAMKYAEMLNKFSESEEYRRYAEMKGRVNAWKKLKSALGKVDASDRDDVEEAILEVKRDMVNELRNK